MNKGSHLIPLLIVLLSAVIGVPVSAQEFKLEPKKYVVPVFSLQSGATIESMVVEYVTLWEPRWQRGHRQDDRAIETFLRTAEPR